MDYAKALLFLVTGLISVTFIQLIGALIARRLAFKHNQLINFSAIIYFSIGYYAAKSYSLLPVLALAGLIALYESMVAFRLAFKVNSDPAFTELTADKPGNFRSTVSVLIVYLLIASTGFLVAKI